MAFPYLNLLGNMIGKGYTWDVVVFIYGHGQTSKCKHNRKSFEFNMEEASKHLIITRIWIGNHQSSMSSSRPFSSKESSFHASLSSYGILESMTFISPNIMGGSSSEGFARAFST